MVAQQVTAMRFKDILKGTVVVVGVGNRLRGDDAVGPLLVERLEGTPGLTCIDAGSTLENHLGRVIRQRPDTVLLVDAVHLGLPPGEYGLLDPGQIVHQGLSTHDVSLKLCLEVLGRSIDGAIFMLGVQPQCLAFGSGVSDVVRRALRILESEISEAITGERV